MFGRHIRSPQPNRVLLRANIAHFGHAAELAHNNVARTLTYYAVTDDFASFNLTTTLHDITGTNWPPKGSVILPKRRCTQIPLALTKRLAFQASFALAWRQPKSNAICDVYRSRPCLIDDTPHKDLTPKI